MWEEKVSQKFTFFQTRFRISGETKFSMEGNAQDYFGFLRFGVLRCLFAHDISALYSLSAKLLLILASTVILGSESHETHDLVYCLTVVGAYRSVCFM
jgi:hypothetical protein